MHIVHRRYPGDDVERYYPRTGLGSLIVAIPVWLGFLINSMLGLFPAIPFHNGGMGVKFHPWFFIQDKLLGGSPKPVWSDAGVITGQELAMLAIALPLTFAAVYCLRKRPVFGNIESHNIDDERELLEMSVAIANTKGTGDANTASIIDSVIGDIDSIDTNVVTKALGEMEAIAVASATEVAASAAAKAELAANVEDDSTTIDSRFTTIVGDESTEAIVSAAADEAKAEGDKAEDLGIETDFVNFHIEEQPESDEEEHEKDKTSKLPSLSEISDFAKRQAAKATTVAKGAAKGVSDTASSVTQFVSDTVDSVRPSGKEDSAQETVAVEPAPPPQRLHTVQSGTIPVRPRGLPPMAEWSQEQGDWLLLGRPVKSTELPEPEAPRPAWAVEEEPPILSATAILVDDLFDEEGGDSPAVAISTPVASAASSSGGLPPLPGSGGSSSRRAPPALPKIP